MHYRYNRLQFSGGQSISLEPNSLLILVGPNNSGKSRSLQDIETLWHGQSHSDTVKVVTSTDISTLSNWNNFKTWVREQYNIKSLGEGVEHFFGIGAELHLSSDFTPNSWAELDSARGFVISRLDTESRLAKSHPPQRIDPYTERPSHFIHILQANNTLLERLQRDILAAFALDLALDYSGGSQIPIYVGEKPSMQEGWDRVHPEYAQAMRNQMIPLHEAGDGVRSYVVTLASALVEAQPVLLIDEPEAFLHPPQARRLGKTLCELATERRRQIIIATHSSDIVRGALSSGGKQYVGLTEKELSLI